MNDLPEHPGIVCPACGDAGVAIRDAECQCGRCGNRWIALLLVGMD